MNVSNKRSRKKNVILVYMDINLHIHMDFHANEETHMHTLTFTHLQTHMYILAPLHTFTARSTTRTFYHY